MTADAKAVNASNEIVVCDTQKANQSFIGVLTLA